VKGLEDRAVHRRVFDGRVGEHQRRRIAVLLRIFRRVGDEILIVIAVERVELAAVLAIVGLGARANLQQRPGQHSDGERAERRDPTIAHEFLH
jgi:hypothetical protein